VGASALAGEMLNALAGLSTPVQVVVSPAERLPGWVGATDAVIAVSSSGATAETLAIATEAARRGCRLAGVGAAGSPLHRIAEQARAPFVPVVPAGLPRSMLWAVAVPLLVIAERLGVTRIGADTYELTATRLEEVSHQCRPASESFVNPGKSLALDLVGALPMVWGTSALSRVAARRFVGQLHENAKYPAIAGVLPEANHNQVVTFDGPFATGPRAADLDLDPDGQAEPPVPLRLILLRDTQEHPQVARRREESARIAADRGIEVTELAASGDLPLERLASLVALIDYTSVYLAIANGIDPAPIAAIQELKARIA